MADLFRRTHKFFLLHGHLSNLTYFGLLPSLIHHKYNIFIAWFLQSSVSARGQHSISAAFLAIQLDTAWQLVILNKSSSSCKSAVISILLHVTIHNEWQVIEKRMTNKGQKLLPWDPFTSQ